MTALLKQCFAVCLLLLLAGSSSIFAQIDIPPGKWWRNDPEIAQALNISPQQKDQIEAIFERYREPMLDLQLDLRTKSLVLNRMLQSDTLDERKIEAQVTAVEQVRGELAKQRMMMLVKIRGILRPEQWHALQEKHAQRQRNQMRPFRPNQRPDIPPPR
ncbi:MAG TPA: Spy/CpxP family protein refolding chaperone [Acidobacteriota bacterium]|jgi:Spy/CpxP family protein refolding chaperone